MRARIRHSHDMQRQWFELVIEDGLLRFVHYARFRERSHAEPLLSRMEAAIAQGYDPWHSQEPDAWVIEDASGPQQS